jgi:hypothetical protein
MPISIDIAKTQPAPHSSAKCPRATSFDHCTAASIDFFGGLKFGIFLENV